MNKIGLKRLNLEENGAETNIVARISNNNSFGGFYSNYHEQRGVIIDKLLKGEDVISEILYTEGGELNVERVFDEEGNVVTNKIPENIITDLKGYSEISELDLVVTDEYGKYVKVSNKKEVYEEFSGDALMVDGKYYKGGVFLVVKKADGSLFPLRLNLKKNSQQEAELLADLVTAITVQTGYGKGKKLSLVNSETTLSEMSKSDVKNVQELYSKIKEFAPKELALLAESGSSGTMADLISLFVYYTPNYKEKTGLITELMWGKNGVHFGGQAIGEPARFIDKNSAKEVKEQLIEFFRDTKRRQFNIDKWNNMPGYREYVVKEGIINTDVKTNEPLFFDNGQSRAKDRENGGKEQRKIRAHVGKIKGDSSQKVELLDKYSDRQIPKELLDRINKTQNAEEYDSSYPYFYKKGQEPPMRPVDKVQKTSVNYESREIALSKYIPELEALPKKTVQKPVTPSGGAKAEKRGVVKPVRGEKQIKRGFENLNKATTPVQKLNAINEINQNISYGAVVTESQKKQIEETTEKLEKEGYDSGTFHVGQKYSDGYNVTPNFIPSEKIPEGERVITRIIKPQINKDGKIIQSAEIEVSVGSKPKQQPTQQSNKNDTEVVDIDRIIKETESDTGLAEALETIKNKGRNNDNTDTIQVENHPFNDGRIVIVDGWHRLAKAILDGKNKVEVVFTDKKPTQQTNSEVEFKKVYHHTSVSLQNFNFGNFQRGKNQVSQFGDGLNAATETNEFFTKRYGQPIEGEVNDKDFVEIDTNLSESEIYDYLIGLGYKINTPQYKSGKYNSKSAKEEYDDVDPANDNPAVINLFNDFQQSNPDVKGVKVVNHIIGDSKVKPFYVIYDAKSFYGPGSLSKQPKQQTVQKSSKDDAREIEGLEKERDLELGENSQEKLIEKVFNSKEYSVDGKTIAELNYLPRNTSNDIQTLKVLSGEKGWKEKFTKDQASYLKKIALNKTQDEINKKYNKKINDLKNKPNQTQQTVQDIVNEPGFDKEISDTKTGESGKNDLNLGSKDEQPASSGMTRAEKAKLRRANREKKGNKIPAISTGGAQQENSSNTQLENMKKATDNSDQVNKNNCNK